MIRKVSLECQRVTDLIFSVNVTLQPFLHFCEMLRQGKAYSTLKVYLEAILVSHIHFDDSVVRAHTLACHFMKRALTENCLSLSINVVVLSWVLSLVLETREAPFEPLKESELKLLSIWCYSCSLIH